MILSIAATAAGLWAMSLPFGCDTDPLAGWGSSIAADRADRWRRAIPPGPVAAPRRPAVVVPAEPPRCAGWTVALRAFSGR